jgi:hypothetical protein
MKAMRLTGFLTMTTFLATAALVLAGAASAFNRVGDDGTGGLIVGTSGTPAGVGDNGFDWVALGVGAAAGVGGCLVLAILTLLFTQRRRRIALQ